MKGFTLIEVLVSVAIFSVVMVIALGALLAISTSNRKAESLKSVINNLNFSLDSMSRAVRYGSGWGCGSSGSAGIDCNLTGDTSISFVPSSGVGRTYYRLDTLNGDICGQTAPYIGCIEKSTDNVNWLPITSPEVVMTNPTTGLFYIVGSTVGTPDNTQPKLVITLTGYVKVTGGAGSQAQCGTAGNQCSVFRLQTTVTQRLYDL